MRKSVLALAAAVLVAGPMALSFFSGGFFDRPRLVAAIAAWGLVLVVALAAPRPLPRSGVARASMIGLAALTAWTAASVAWAPVAARAEADVQRLLLYLAVLVAAAALWRGRAIRRWLEPALALGTFVVIGYALLGRLLPALIPMERSRTAQGRLEQPLTYWNATGCLAAIGLILCVRVAGDPDRPRGLRAAAGFAGVPLALGTYLTFSRGSLLAAVGGLALLALLAPAARFQLRAMAVVVAGGVVAVLAAAAFFPDVTSLPPGTKGDTGAGAVMLAILVVLSATAAAGVGRMRPVAAGPPRAIASARRGLVLAGVVVTLTAGIGLVAALESGTADRSAGAPTSAARFKSLDSVRYAFWRVSLDEFADAPLGGRGSGGFAVDWREEPDRPEAAVDAHSLYIETLGELGLVGILALGAFLVPVGLAGARLYQRDPALAAGSVAAVAAWALHAGIDWDWEMPALSGIAVMLMGAVLGWFDESETGPVSGAAA